MIVSTEMKRTHWQWVSVREGCRTEVAMEVDGLRIALDFPPAEADVRRLRERLGHYNASQLTAPLDVRFGIFLRGADGQLRGGLLAKAGRGWLHIGALWVDASSRGQGYGTRMMDEAEAEGRRRGCHGAYLDTFSYQARPFYERRGYVVFGTLEDFPTGHQKYFMRKVLK